MRRLAACLLLFLSLAALGSPPPEPGPAFAARYCASCHSGPEPDGNLLLDGKAPITSRTWERAFRKLQAGAMPPDDHEGPFPSASEVAALGSWLRAQGHLPRVAPPRPSLRRLTRAEYEHAVRDLLGVHGHPTRDWPRDEVADGFDTSTAAAALTPSFVRRALDAAERVAAEAIHVLDPLKERIDAAKLEAQGRAHPAGGGWVKLVTNGSFAAELRIPHAGRYRIRARVYGDQAGGEPVRVGLRVSGKRHGIRSTKSTRDDPATLTFVVPLQPGKRRVEVSFLNDYWNPEAKDPNDRDRNLSLRWIELEGPLDAPPLPPGHERLLGGAKRLEWAAIPDVLARLATRAYRREVTKSEVARLTSAALSVRARGGSPEGGLRIGLTALLASPHFLLRRDLDGGPQGAVPRALPPRQLAARLSFFLWASLPDEALSPALTRAAAAGELETALRAQAARLLDDPRAVSLVEDFGRQWLQLQRLDEANPDPVAFPGFDEPLRDAMRAETELVLEAILREDRPVHEVIDGRFTFVNARLAKHYGWEGVEGERFRRVALPPERSGLLTHASVLTLTSEPERTSLVKRGKWLLEVVLADPPPPPPPGADSFTPEAKARPDLPFAKRMELHRTRADCRSCHERMDPLGVALERFSGTGALRRNAETINVRATLPDGQVLDGVAGLREALRRQRARFTRGLARALLTYALGRPLALVEQEELDALTARLGPEVGLRTLVIELCLTKTFRQGWRRAEEGL